MKRLLVEDDPNKMRQLAEFIREEFPGDALLLGRSYQSGLRVLLEEHPDAVVLDMSMPTFDVGGVEKGGRPRHFGGRDILREMSRRRVSATVIVVTQFETFGEGTQRKTLEELRSELAHEFPGLFAGTIYYHPAQSDWKLELRALLRSHMRETAK